VLAYYLRDIHDNKKLLLVFSTWKLLLSYRDSLASVLSDSPDIKICVKIDNPLCQRFVSGSEPLPEPTPILSYVVSPAAECKIFLNPLLTQSAFDSESSVIVDPRAPKETVVTLSVPSIPSTEVCDTTCPAHLMSKVARLGRNTSTAFKKSLSRHSGDTLVQKWIRLHNQEQIQEEAMPLSQQEEKKKKKNKKNKKNKNKNKKQVSSSTVSSTVTGMSPLELGLQYVSASLVIQSCFRRYSASKIAASLKNEKQLIQAAESADNSAVGKRQRKSKHTIWKKRSAAAVRKAYRSSRGRFQ